MPMTIDAGDNVDTPDCTATDQSTTGPFSSRGWRACPPERAGTADWLGHPGLIAYFPSLLGGRQIGTLTRSPNVDNALIRSTGQLRTDTTGINAQTNIINLFKSGGALASVAQGDYVYIKNGTLVPHGFLVVGWGPLKGTKDGIDWAMSNTLASSRSDTNPIPYVSDFCFGTDTSTNDGTGWLEDPRPRPFYTAATIVAGDSNLRPDELAFLRRRDVPPLGVVTLFDEFVLDTWVFIKIPDTVSLTNVPITRMYFCG
jgi:hypothetical protein